jgi:pimeloyl-ACP methyl ester carboxylesterase
MKATCFELTIPGFTIACKAWGDSKLPPMIALHGWLDNANSFDALAPYLENRYYLVAIDLPGHGLSSHIPEGCYYHFIDGIFNTLKIIQALDFDRIHLLGHSMGACLASLIAGVVPDQILSMTLIEALGPLAAPQESCCAQLTNFYQHALNVDDKKERPYPSLSRAAEARAARGYLSLEHAAILCQRGVRQEGDSFYWRHDRRLLYANPLRMTEVQVLSCLSNITTPSRLIWAKEGFDFCEDVIKEREKAVKNLEIFHLPGGHHIHMETPDKIAQCMA